MYIINYKGAEFWDKLHTLNAVQLRDVDINYQNPIMIALKDSAGIRYIEFLKSKKSDFGAWYAANKDEVLPYLATGAGIITTAATGGAAAPAIPLFSVVGNLLTGKTITNEKDVIKSLQDQIYLEINKKDIADNRKKYYLWGIIVLIIIIILYLIYVK